MFWEYFRNNYSEYLNGIVYEYGSQDDPNFGDEEPVKKCCLNAKKHVGIDWRGGNNVDVIGLAHEVTFPEKADAVLSASMFEHDPYWDLSLTNMVKWLNDDGIIVLTWCSMASPEHCHCHSPQNAYYHRPAKIFVDKLNELGVSICEFMYEGNRFKGDQHIYSSPEGMGEVCLIGFKGEVPSNLTIRIDEYYGADKNLVDFI